MEIYDNKIFSILGNLFFLFEKIEIRSHDSLTVARLISISRKIKRNRKLLFAKSVIFNNRNARLNFKNLRSLYYLLLSSEVPTHRVERISK